MRVKKNTGDVRSISVWVSPSLDRQLRLEAAKREVSRSQIMREFLEQGVRKAKGSTRGGQSG